MPMAGTAALRAAADRWLFRVTGPEAAPIRLVQRRIFALPTGAGIGFACVLLVMLIASINYNLSLGHALVFLLAGSAAASMLHAFRNLFGLAIRPGRCAPVFCGDTVNFQVLVANPHARRRPALRLSALGQSVTFEAAAGDETAVGLPCPSMRRGWLTMGRSVIETRWPLGLIQAWSVFVPDVRCLVFPAPEPDPPALPTGGEGAREARARKGEGDDDFAGLRAHRTADSPRHVAWKVLARGGPMLTKQYAGAEGRELVLDWDALDPGLDTESRLSRLCAWVLQAEARGLRYALALPGMRSPCASGSAHRDRCLERLALFAHAEDAA